MRFILKNTLKSIKKNIRINVIISLTLFVAYLFFFLGCCYIEDGWQDINSYKMKDMSHSIYFRTSDEGFHIPDLLTREEFDQFFHQYDFLENATVTEWYYFEDPITGTSIGYHLIQDNFDDLFFIDMVEGRYFTSEELQNGSPVCLLEKTGKDLRNVEVGDSIVFDEGTELEIIGIIKRNANSGTVYVPQTTFQDDRDRDRYFQGYIIGAELTDPSKRFEIQWNQVNLYGELFTADEFLNESMRFLLGRDIPILIVSAILMIYALFNLINIMVSKMDEQKKSLGIRVALGATNRQIFLQFFFECIILVLAAVALVFLLEPLTGQLVKTMFNHYFGLFSVGTMLLMSVVSSFFISMALFRRFKTVKIVEIIKKS